MEYKWDQKGTSYRSPSISDGWVGETGARKWAATERQSVAYATDCRSVVSWQHINLHGEFYFSGTLVKAMPFRARL